MPSGNGGNKGRIAHLLGLGPLVSREKLLLVTALHGAADAVDAVVRLLGGEACQGLGDVFALLLEQVIEPIVWN